jgi:predicted rRNA methylase YqxC with S4 and FtsJ domains
MVKVTPNAGKPGESLILTKGADQAAIFFEDHSVSLTRNLVADAGASTGGAYDSH